MPGKPTIPRACEHCGAPFMAHARKVRIGQSRFCSRRCSALVCGFGVYSRLPREPRDGKPVHPYFTDRPRRDEAERFWEKVSKTDCCWLWIGTGIPSSYGQFAIRKDDGRWTHEGAHVTAWRLTNGPVPTGMEVCHNCPCGDKKRCVRPDHLFVDTHLENVRDAVRKGRIPSGDRHYRRRHLTA